jgi:hypothetical protein
MLGRFAGWILLAVFCFSLGASAMSNPVSDQLARDDQRRHQKWNAPEGGPAVGYLLLAAVSCGGAIALRRRQLQHAKKSV